MPLLEYIDEIFPPSVGNLTIQEIVRRLESRYSPDANYHRVRRALVSLLACQATADAAMPIEGSFPRLYTPATAIRITRRLSARIGAPDRAILLRSKLDVASELIAELDAREIKSNRIANRSQLKRKPTAKLAKTERLLS